MKDNIAIIGLMEEYNKAVSLVLSDKLNMFFLNLQDYTAYLNGMPVNAIISDYGYEYYYNVEKQGIKSLKNYENTLLFCSATASISEDNLKRLKNDFTLILITASKNVTKKDIINNINLINRDDFIFYFNKYTEQLNVAYTSYFDIVIDVTRNSPLRTSQKIIDELLEIFQAEITS